MQNVTQLQLIEQQSHVFMRKRERKKRKQRQREREKGTEGRAKK